MTTQQIADFEGLKARMKATWMAGDYDRVGRLTEDTANEFIARRSLKAGTRVLDVACGTGNLSIPAAKAGAIVTGVDIAPNLLERARARATQEGLAVRFDEGDAEDLPYEDGSFELVISMFGVMFAPRADLAAKELTRVCRAGGQIAMASWTPTGFIGELFKVTGRHVAAPTGVPSPLLWGDDARVRDRLRALTTEVKPTRLIAQLRFPLSVPETVEFYRVHYGPTLRAFAGLSEAAQAALRRDLEDLYIRRNDATDGTTSIAAEYLEVIALKA
jgi:ubiquinone/menaquinone biosynthesis C-methylase UbiE